MALDHEPATVALDRPPAGSAVTAKSRLAR